MAKVADVKLGWTKSPSADVTGVRVVVTKNGTETTTEVGPEVESIQIEVEASASVSFQVVVLDSEGNTATSDTYTFVLGDLESPLPAGGLFHTVLAVRDVGVPAGPPV